MRILPSIMIALLMTSEAHARCAYTPVEETYSQASSVFIGQVVALKLLTENPRANQPVTYEVTIRPLRVLKGPDPGPTSFTNSILYHGPTLDDAMTPNPDPEVRTLVLIDEHDVGYPIGELYFVFLSHGVDLVGGGCSPFIKHFNKDALKELEELRK